MEMKILDIIGIILIAIIAVVYRFLWVKAEKENEKIQTEFEKRRQGYWDEREKNEKLKRKIKKFKKMKFNY